MLIFLNQSFSGRDKGSGSDEEEAGRKRKKKDKKEKKRRKRLQRQREESGEEEEKEEAEQVAPDIEEPAERNELEEEDGEARPSGARRPGECPGPWSPENQVFVERIWRCLLTLSGYSNRRLVDGCLRLNAAFQQEIEDVEIGIESAL
jgi:hypothetical protein